MYLTSSFIINTPKWPFKKGHYTNVTHDAHFTGNDEYYTALNTVKWYFGWSLKNEKYLKNNTNDAIIMLFTCITGISGSSIFRAWPIPGTKSQNNF